MRTDEQPERRARRPRRLPRRRSDRVEALTTWVLCGLVAATLLATALVGGSVHAFASDRIRAEQSDRRPVPAVAVADAPVVPGDGGVGPTYGAVGWTAPDGTERAGSAQVPPLTKAGGAVTVWTDDRGDVVAPPLGSEFPLVMTATSVVFTLLAGFVLIVFAVLGERRLLDRLRAAEWGAGWRRVEPVWSGREDSGRR
jgi:hypothetical protein